MKTAIKTLAYILTVALLYQCNHSDPIPIINIPDNNFLDALIELGVDRNGDGIIEPAEAEVILSLEVSYDSITDMTGIEAFVNLDTLN